MKKRNIIYNLNFMKALKKFFRNLKTAFRGAYKAYFDDECYLKASALSFYTLLAIVPVLAVAFGIAKGFGFEKILENQIQENFYQQPQFAQKMIDFANSALSQAKGGVIAGMGLIFLLWSAFGLLGNFEAIMNTIWNAPEIRRYTRKISDYLTILILTPLFIASTGTLTVLITKTLVNLTEGKGIYDIVRPFIYVNYYFLLLGISWIFFALLYSFIPNKVIPWSACMLGGFLAAVLFQIVQWSYIHFQVYLTSYNAIYGSFAAIPLFLIWLQISWLIILIGGEVGSHYSETT